MFWLGFHNASIAFKPEVSVTFVEVLVAGTTLETGEAITRNGYGE